MPLTNVLIGGVALGAALFLAGCAGLLAGSAPADLGVHKGLLKAPSKTRNSVTSQADRFPEAKYRDYARIAPLAFSGEPAAAMARLASVVEGMDGAVLVTRQPDYLYATFTTRWLRFVDDVEFALDAPAGVIDVRSASRLGAEDFGTNRRRIEAIRSAFDAGR